MAGVIEKWSTSPPCPAHVNLVKLFKENKVKSVYTAGDTLRHNLISKNRLMAVLSKEVAEDDSLVASGPSGASKRVRSSTLTDDTEEKDLEGLDLQIVHHNQPALVTVYKDPETQQEKVFIIMSLPGGSTEEEFSLVGNGPGSSTAHIRYSWPSVIYDFDLLFAKVSIRNEKVSEFQPKIIALKNELENHRDSVDSIPREVIEIPLPISVQTAINSYKFVGGEKSLTGVSLS